MERKSDPFQCKQMHTNMHVSMGLCQRRLKKKSQTRANPAWSHQMAYESQASALSRFTCHQTHFLLFLCHVSLATLDFSHKPLGAKDREDNIRW